MPGIFGTGMEYNVGGEEGACLLSAEHKRLSGGGHFGRDAIEGFCREREIKNE